METIKIEGKDYLIDIEKCKEQGLLKEKDNEPRSWEEWKQRLNSEGVTLYYTMGLGGINTGINTSEVCYWWCQLTEQRARALAAFGKLLQLRDAWVGDWKPDWEDNTFKYCIINEHNRITNSHCWYCAQSLSFPTAEMRDDFFKTFRDLIEEAKELI